MVLEARKVAGFVGVCQCSESERKILSVKYYLQLKNTIPYKNLSMVNVILSLRLHQTLIPLQHSAATL